MKTRVSSIEDATLVLSLKRGDRIVCFWTWASLRACLKCHSHETQRSHWKLPEWALFASNAKVALDHSGRECHWKSGFSQCHASARFKLKICAAYLDRWEVYKRLRLLTVNSLDCSSLSIWRTSEDQKLLSFLRTHKASSFSLISFERFNHTYGTKSKGYRFLL